MFGQHIGDPSYKVVLVPLKEQHNQIRRNEMTKKIIGTEWKVDSKTKELTDQPLYAEGKVSSTASTLTQESKNIEKKETLSGFVNTRPSVDYYHKGNVCDLYVHPQGDYEVVSIYWRENRANGLTGEKFVSKDGVARSFSLRGLNMTLTEYLEGIKTGALVGRNKEGLPVTAVFEFELLGE